MSNPLPNVAILGCGTMGQAIVGGLLECGAITPDQIVVTARREVRASELRARYGIAVTLDNAEAASQGEVAILAVKPKNAREVLTDTRLVEALRGKTLISICAGVRLAQIAEWLPETQVLRAMPNTPSLIREGMTVLSPGPLATEATMDVAERIFASVGRVLRLPEHHLDAVTGLSGSGPAFVCVVVEALADGGVMMGLPRDVAVELAAQTVQGAARMVLETGLHPAALKDEVTTPAGCTIAGLLTMEDRGIRSTLARTIETATKVAAGLGD